ncbi:MAG: cupin domain-containing protein [Acetobacter sp.]|uniref:cupin domain-containing protein n=1 Tax=Acetobacter sp. TaxID=440 RepID=UPI0039E94E2C
MTAGYIARSAEVSEADILIGRRLRALRLEKGLSLAELSGRAGISVGALSQIERGLSSLRVKVMWPLAAALSVEPEELVSDAGEPRHDLYCVPASARKMLPVYSEGISKSLLSPPSAALTGMLVVVEPGATSGSYTHAGHEFGYIVSGQLILWIDGVHYRLGKGDSFAFRSCLDHSFSNNTQDIAEILWVNTSKPEKDHEHGTTSQA